MSTTQINSTTHIVRNGEKVIGKIVMAGKGTTYRAARRNGTADDARRVAYGFRSIKAAEAFITAS